MPPPPHTKPENVLKASRFPLIITPRKLQMFRAQELLGVGSQQAALQILHEHVTNKRNRNNSIAALEPVMLLYVQLCVDLKKGKFAKEGLYNYKNFSQNTNVQSIELVSKKFIELAEQKVTEAQAKADEVQSSLENTISTENVDDLEAIETPESILLSTVSGEQSRDRTDRAIVTPWLKFLWETYRTVLDIFKNNARLEVTYQSTAHQAFQFCSKYVRKTEFRRLCELLRNHLSNAAKYSSQMHAINLSDPETLQRHLDTRFQQLNVAVELELWQEAFKSVEDIHTLLNLSKRPAKNSMMANYFEKLTRIFLVSENYLFHAAAWSRYYNLLRQSAAAVTSGQGARKDNPNVSEEYMTKAASFVLLSALSIPVISTSRSRGALVDIDEARKNKNSKLTILLGMSQAPTRAILFKDALSKGLLKKAKPEIRELYNILEVDFHPLSICKKIAPILTQIGSDPEMEKYVLPLQQVILTRLFQQLSQVYESVELKFVHELAQFPDPFQVTSDTIEKFIMNGCKKGDLAIRIDHATSVLTFDSDVFSAAKALHSGSAAGSAESESSSVQRLQSTPAEIVRSQLTRLAKSLFITCQYVDPTFNEDRQKSKAAAYARAQAGAEQEHLATLARKDVIEKKKQTAASALAAKEKEEATRKRLRAQQLQEAEIQRLAEEQRDREQKRLKAEQQRVQREEIEKQIKELKQGIKGVDLDELDINELDSGRIRALKLAALEKEKNELGERLRVTGKRIDHLERAFRREEIKHLPEDLARQREQDLAAYEKAKAVTLRDAEEKHGEDVALKHRLSKLVTPYEKFKKNVEKQRAAEFDKRRKAAERELNQKIEQRKKDFRERKAREKREREKEERRLREEEEQRVREEEEKAREEEEKREKLEKLKAERARQREEADRVAALQRQREEEAEAKAKARRAGAVPERRPLERPAAPERPDSSDSRGPPRLALAGNKPTWREREAARKAAEANGEAPQAESQGPPAAPPAAPPTDERVATQEAALPKRTGYVPPHLRTQGGVSPAPRGRTDGDDASPRVAAESGSRDRDATSNESPATAGSGRYQLPSSRGGASGGAYKPGAFRGARKE
ncbi:Eukaryotic translation initiation factor 3 subunit A [Cryomyces minteri]|uniref:Eukaryotic translation initiation factor 3 subunit A n=1 Tax=Cryomyces minteri TaxID=331657 RepID=A0A4V6WL68_9PEZI|nr:Eukaryotic translation initiation factor 3 subunit A [Cryomyces minteri]